LNNFVTLNGYCLSKFFVAMQFCIPVNLMRLQLLVPMAVQFVDAGRGPGFMFKATTRFKNLSCTHEIVVVRSMAIPA
jgi:hypothetical protein